MKAVSHQGDFIRVISHEGASSSGWSLRMVFHQGGILSGWYFIMVVYCQDGLSSILSFIRDVFLSSTVFV